MVKERSTDRYYVRSTTARSIDTVHTDPECQALSTAKRVREVDRGRYPDATVCQRCSGAGCGGGPDGPTLAGQLRAADSLEELQGGSEV